MPAPITSTDEDGPSRLVWGGLAVAVIAAVAGFIAWRRRPAPAGRSSGRARPSTASTGRRGPQSRAANR
ncbi:hypothetical protein, partial [Micromonospora tarensis]|uniref:hypothetical protein n=1 Tax=Micromonospora tarensis TaxID=2806100 RepID=UPI001EE4D80E